MATNLHPENNKSNATSEKLPTYDELQKELAKVKPSNKTQKVKDAQNMCEEQSRSCSH